MTVLSNLGQPLRAEIDLVSVQADEAQSLAVRLPSPDVFDERGVDYNSYVRGLRFEVSRRDNGQYFIRVNSNQSINEPYVDFLVELSWAGGRIIRQYTDVLDPAGYNPNSGKTPAVVSVPQTESSARGRSSASTTSEPAVKQRQSAVRHKRSRTAPIERETDAPPQSAAASDKAGSADSHRVRQGETLGQIAGRYKPSGINLDQMLYGLYKNNTDAFINQNINRLKSGTILRIPPKQDLSSISKSEAAREIRAHASDWNSYRQGLADAVSQAPAAKAGDTATSASGKLKAKAEDKAAPAANGPRDVVKLSRGDAAGNGQAAAQQRLKALEEENAARERSLKEANERVAQLEKNISDMQRLLELKSKAAADLQKQNAEKAAKPAATGTVKPAAEQSTPATAPKTASPVVAEPVKPETPPEAASAPVASAPVNAAASAAAGQTGASAPASAPVQTAETPVEKLPEPAAVEQPVEEESSLMEHAPLIGGGLLGLGLIGALIYAMRRRRARPSFEDSVLTGGDLKSNTVLGSVGASIVDTASTTDNSFFTDFSREGLGSIDTDEVDPVAEAEVYMAYGRDAQAEEILKDALIKDGSRQEVRLKLMEIYANRKNIPNFELYATELHTATGGTGPLWERAAAMGRELDPNNPLYGGTAATSNDLPALDDVAPVVVTDSNSASTPAASDSSDLDFEIGTVKMQAVSFDEPQTAAPTSDDALVDFDLGTDSQAQNADTTSSADFDMNSPEEQPVVREEAEESPILDFQFDLGEPAPAAAQQTVRLNAEEFAAPELDEEPVKIYDAPSAETSKAPDDEVTGLNFDFNNIDLDLNAPDANTERAEETIDLTMPNLQFDQNGNTQDQAAFAGGEGMGFNLDELETAGLDAPEDPIETKLDLAKAYLEMGDHEGAREILNEAVNEGTDQQRQRAEAMLSAI